MKTQKGTLLPNDFAKTLGKNPKAWAVFESMRPSCQRRYVDWINEARKRETRERRIKKAGAMILDYGRRHKSKIKPKTERK